MCYVRPKNPHKPEVFPAKLVDCETYKDHRGMDFKGSKFCWTDDRPDFKDLGCGGPEKKFNSTIDNLRDYILGIKKENGCYPYNSVFKKYFCLCSTDGCNSGIHKQNTMYNY